jgi:hypothetical protein
MLFMFFNAHGEYFFCTSKDFSHQQHLSATSCCWEVSIFKDWIRIFFLSKTSCTTTPEKTPKTPQNQPTGYSKHYLDPQILVGIGNSIQHLWTTCCGTKWNETCSNSFVIHLACWGAWAHESWQCSGKFGDYVVPRCTTTIVGIIIAKHRSLLRIYRSLLFIPIVVKNMYILTIVIVTTCYYQHFRKKKHHCWIAFWACKTPWGEAFGPGTQCFSAANRWPGRSGDGGTWRDTFGTENVGFDMETWMDYVDFMGCWWYFFNVCLMGF